MRVNFCCHFNDVRSPLAHNPAATGLCFLFVLLFPRLCGSPAGWSIDHRWCLGPAVLKAGRALVRVRARTRAVRQASTEGRSDRSRVAPGPRSTAARLRVRVAPARSTIRITNTQRPAYRTAEPSDSPPPASRYALTAGRCRAGAAASLVDCHAQTQLPYFPISARSPHGSGRSTPSRDKPLTARSDGRSPWRASRGESARGRT